jgi:hypothetical protein
MLQTLYIEMGILEGGYYQRGMSYAGRHGKSDLKIGRPILSYNDQPDMFDHQITFQICFFLKQEFMFRGLM